MSRLQLTAFAVALGLLSAVAAAQTDFRLTARSFPPDARVLIIHADDLGMSHSVNRATLEALEKGWITSSSILVPCPWFPEVAHWAQAHPDADLGIHLALNSEWTELRWGPLTARDQVPSLLDADGYFPLEETAVVEHAKVPEVDRELRAQIAQAQAAGVHVTHLDTHMATLTRTADLFNEYQKLGDDFHLPILLDKAKSRPAPKNFSPSTRPLIDAIIEISPDVPASDWVAWYKRRLAALKPGIYEVIVHLGYDDEEMRGATAHHPDWGAAWRQRDLDMVRSEDFRMFLHDQRFILVGWKQILQ